MTLVVLLGVTSIVRSLVEVSQDGCSCVVLVAWKGRRDARSLASCCAANRCCSYSPVVVAGATTVTVDALRASSAKPDGIENRSML